MPDPNHLMTLSLTKANGDVLAEWTIAEKVDFNTEDLSTSPRYDFYLDERGNKDFFSEEVWDQEIIRLYETGFFN